MSARGVHAEAARVATASERVAGLLARYPALSEQEKSEILDFLRTGRHLDVGLLTSSDALRPQLDAFREEHKAQLQLRWAEIVGFTAAISAAAAALWIGFEALN